MNLRVIVISIFFVLHGCAKQPQINAPIAEAEPKVVVSTPPAKKLPPPQVVIFTSENIPAYAEVAQTLAKRLAGRGSVIYLPGNHLDDMKLAGKFRSEDRMQFVSIGLTASIAAKSLTDKQVVFCQVYNYQDYALLSGRHKGVSMLPSFARTFSAWRTLSPTAKNIGVISGPGFEDAIQAARAAAKIHGFTLQHETVNSDKEYQYAYKNMSKKVQGYWLLPDNRVLSENILRDIMTFSVRNSKQVAVFNDELLKLGGLLSISSDHREIAHQVFERLEQAQGKDTIPGPDIVYLDNLNLRINSVMARRLDIAIPRQYRKYAKAL
jgi:ABC-type uncharacterized transport system substrate-binding protein